MRGHGAIIKEESRGQVYSYAVVQMIGMLGFTQVSTGWLKVAKTIHNLMSKKENKQQGENFCLL